MFQELPSTVFRNGVHWTAPFEDIYLYSQSDLQDSKFLKLGFLWQSLDQQLRNQDRHLKLVRSNPLLCSFEVLISMWSITSAWWSWQLPSMEIYDLSEENELDTYMSREVPVPEGDESQSLARTWSRPRRSLLIQSRITLCHKCLP